jgi:hypothetical protein
VQSTVMFSCLHPARMAGGHGVSITRGFAV